MPASSKRRLSATNIRAMKAETALYRVWDTAQPHLAVQVRPNGKKRFVFWYRLGGKQKWYTFPDFYIPETGEPLLEQAREETAEKLLQTRKGVDVVAVEKAARAMPQDRHTITFKELSDRYIEEYGKRRNRSWKQTLGDLKRSAFPKFGDWPVMKIERADVREIFDEETNKGNEIGANRTLSSISSVFDFCIEKEIVPLAANPALGIKRNPSSERRKGYSDDQVRALWPAFSSYNLHTDCILKLMLITGQRQDEVRAIRWEDIEGAWWTIKFHKRSKPNDPKWHRVYLTASALAVLEEMGPQETGWVFPGSKGKHIGNIGDPAKKAIRKTSDVDDFTAHRLRHTVVTNMFKLGVEEKHISRVVNHSEGGTTSLYNDYGFDKEKKAALLKWEEHLHNIIDNKTHENVISIA